MLYYSIGKVLDRFKSVIIQADADSKLPKFYPSKKYDNYAYNSMKLAGPCAGYACDGKVMFNQTQRLIDNGIPSETVLYEMTSKNLSF